MSEAGRPIARGYRTSPLATATRGWCWTMGSFAVEIGERDVWGGTSQIGLSRADRRQHLYLIGQSGSGKSTLLDTLIVQDMHRGEGLALIDPHGDLALEILAQVPRHRIRDVVFIDPSEMARPVGINPLFRVPPDERALVADNLVDAFRSIWGESWGPQLEEIFLNTLLALMDAPDHTHPTLLSVLLVLFDDAYRARVVQHIRDPSAAFFFTKVVPTWRRDLLAEKAGSTRNKVSQLLANPMLRNILGQWRPSIDFSAVLEEKRILVVRIPKGLIGAHFGNLFGSMIVTGLYQAAMRRAASAMDGREDFYLYVDEFQNFTTSTFEHILSEARKYRLNLTIAHQYLAQLPPGTKDAILGNASSLVSFRVSAEDAVELARTMGEYQPSALRGLGTGEICTQLIADGSPAPPCLAKTTRLGGYSEERRDRVCNWSHARYGRPRAKVEAQILQRMGLQ